MTSKALLSTLCLIAVAIAATSPEDQIVPEADLSIIKDFEEAHNTLELVQADRKGPGCKCLSKQVVVDSSTAAFLDAMLVTSEQTGLVQETRHVIKGLKGTPCQTWSVSTGVKWCTVSSSCKAATGTVANMKIKSGKCVPYCTAKGVVVPAKAKCAISSAVVAARKQAADRIKKEKAAKKKAAEKKYKNRFRISHVKQCKGATTFAGETSGYKQVVGDSGLFYPKYNNKQVADFWCRKMGWPKAASWSAVKGKHHVCSISRQTQKLYKGPLQNAKYTAKATPYCPACSRGPYSMLCGPKFGYTCGRSTYAYCGRNGRCGKGRSHEYAPYRRYSFSSLKYGCCDKQCPNKGAPTYYSLCSGYGNNGKYPPQQSFGKKSSRCGPNHGRQVCGSPLFPTCNKSGWCRAEPEYAPYHRYSYSSLAPGCCKKPKGKGSCVPKPGQERSRGSFCRGMSSQGSTGKCIGWYSNYCNWQSDDRIDLKAPMTVGTSTSSSFGCSKSNGHRQCLKNLKCAGKKATVTKVTGCKGATTLAGPTKSSEKNYHGVRGSAKYTYQQLADFWCKKSGKSKAASWSVVKGNQHGVCAISGTEKQKVLKNGNGASRDCPKCPAFEPKYGPNVCGPVSGYHCGFNKFPYCGRNGKCSANKADDYAPHRPYSFKALPYGCCNKGCPNKGPPTYGSLCTVYRRGNLWKKNTRCGPNHGHKVCGSPLFPTCNKAGWCQNPVAPEYAPYHRYSYSSLGGSCCLKRDHNGWCEARRGKERSYGNMCKNIKDSSGCEQYVTYCNWRPVIDPAHPNMVGTHEGKFNYYTTLSIKKVSSFGCSNGSRKCLKNLKCW